MSDARAWWRARLSGRGVPGPGLPPGFGVLWTTVAVDLLGFGIVVPLLPLYARHLGAGPASVGLLLASFSAAQFVGAPLLGKLSDRVGRKPVLIVSLVGTDDTSLQPIHARKQYLARDIHVIKWERAFARNLHFLVALSGDQHDVSGRGLVKGKCDGGAPVWLHRVPGARTLQADDRIVHDG